ncbi:16S rRNA (guanine(527)-N(7))-methyltransferase RsmG [bacterium]
MQDLKLEIQNISSQILGVHFLSERQIYKLVEYFEFLKQENKKKNLISRKSTDQDILNKHFVSSFLFVKWILDLNNKMEVKKIIDLGTGGGFPGLICALSFPDIMFSFIDASIKKVDFLYDASSLMQLKNVDCLWGRIEDFWYAKALQNNFDIVTARALGTIPVTTKYAFPFLRKDGIFLTIKSDNQENEFQEAKRYVEQIGAEISFSQEEIDNSYMVFVKKLNQSEDSFLKKTNKKQMKSKKSKKK